MATVVRKATPADRDALLELAEDMLGETIFGRWFPFNYTTMAPLVDNAIADAIVQLLEVDGQVVGMLAGGPLMSAFSGDWLFDELCWYVRPEHRRGLGGVRLLRAVEEMARQLGLSLFTMVAPAGSEVGAFYERDGYIPIETKYVKRLK